MQIKGAVAVIIGGANGIGKAMVDMLLRLGAKVMFGDYEEATGEATLKEFQSAHGEDRIAFMKCDIQKKADIQGIFKATISKWERIDILCPVAGILHETEWEYMIATNLVGSIQSVKEVMKHMAKDEGGAGGTIVILSSIQAIPAYTFYNSPVYAATKSALLSYASSMGSQDSFAHHGVRINCLCPGVIDTRILKWLEEDKDYFWLHSEEARRHHDQLNLTMTQPSSVAAALVHCIEDDKMKGQALFIANENEHDVITKLNITVPPADLVAKIKVKQ